MQLYLDAHPVRTLSYCKVIKGSKLNASALAATIQSAKPMLRHKLCTQIRFAFPVTDPKTRHRPQC